MTSLRNQLLRFWRAEEIPRWFSLSVFFVFLGGMTGVAYLGVRDTHIRGARRIETLTQQGFIMLAQRLTAMPEEDVPAARRVLRDFAAGFNAAQLRLVNGERRIVLSIDAAEEGRNYTAQGAASAIPRGLEVIDLNGDDDQSARRIYRAPLSASLLLPPVPSELEAAPRFVEMVITAPSAPAGILEWVTTLSGPLCVVLTGCGALLILYRRLRRQMRGISHIARRLEHRSPDLETAISDLRIADETDALSQQWNALVGLVETLNREVKRSQAAAELTHALSAVSGGALRTALHALPDALLYLVEGERIEYANAAARRLLSLPDGDGQMTLDRAQPTGAARECLAMIRQAYGQEGGIESRSQIVHTEHDDTHYRVRVLPLRGEHAERQCLVVISDVSQQIRADKASEEFIYQVTHELRTPLTNIRAYAETLASGMFDDPKVITECYNVITKETRRLERLVNDMLNMSQMEVGAIQLAVDNVDLRALLTDAVRDVRGLAEEKHIDLRLTLPAKLETIRADRDKLNVVINNLLGNALKYTPDGGNVIVGAQISGEQVMITVKDNGIGIAPADQPRVFDKFVRADDPYVKEQTGTGVGLYTAREITRRHGGDIEVISAKGQGSTFIVRLPHKPSRAAV